MAMGCLEERESGDVVQCRCASVWPVDGGLTSWNDDMPERGDQQAVAVLLLMSVEIIYFGGHWMVVWLLRAMAFASIHRHPPVLGISDDPITRIITR